MDEDDLFLSSQISASEGTAKISSKNKRANCLERGCSVMAPNYVLQ